MFHSSVQQAVSDSVSKALPLLVLVENGDSEFTQLIRGDKVAAAIKDRAVALSVTEGSQECAFFAQVFPFDSVPSLHIIMGSQRLKVLGGESSKEDVLATLNTLLSRLASVATQVPRNTAEPSQDQGSPTSSGSQAGSHLTPRPKEQAKEQAKKPSSKAAKGKAPEPSSDHHGHHPDKPSKINATDEERKRINQLLEMDRKERLANKKYKDQLQSESTGASRVAKKPSAQHTHCALAIRLFDGSSLKHRFLVTDTLEQVRSWIDGNRTDGRDMPYKFYQSIPEKRQFSERDEQESLQELGLVPSSTLILKPIHHSFNAYDKAGSGSLIGSSAGWLQSAGKSLSDSVYSFLGYSVGTTAPQSDGGGSSSSSTNSSSGDNGNSGSRDETIKYNGNHTSLED